MEALSLILVIAGLVVMAIGAYLVYKPPPTPPPTEATPQDLPDIGEIVKQIKELLLVFQANLRTGLAIMIMGLVLVSLGVFLAVQDAKDEVKDQSAVSAVLA